MPPNTIGITSTGGPSGSRSCRKFQSNVFSSSRCQNCYQQKEAHTQEALDEAKVRYFFNRNIFFFLYSISSIMTRKQTVL